MSAESPGAPRSGWTPVTERLERFLREQGARFRIMEHAPVFTSEEAARVRGTPIESGAKALVFLAADRPVHVVLPGARRDRQCPAARGARLPHPALRDAMQSSSP